MKLLIILSVIACSYGDKLDRTYLPPDSAGTAGGSPGSIAAPGTETELGVPKGTIFGSSAGQTSGPSSLGQPSGPSFGKPTGSSIGQPSGPKIGQPSRPVFGQPSGPSFGQPTGSAIGQPSVTSFGQPSGSLIGQTSGPSFGQPLGSSFDQQGQNQAGVQSGSAQPGQPGAGLIGSQYNQAGNSGNAGTPGFTQAGTEFNNAPIFNGQSQAPTAYNEPSQPERARASIDRNAETLHYENNIDGDTFAYSFETSNGIAADEAGIATNGVRAQGGFSYTGDDGQFYSVRYTADENGYVPQGDHLPTPHPIPEDILKSLEENARAAAAGTQEGAYNPNEDSNLDNGASYPTLGSNAYQPVQGSVSQYNGPDASSVTARPQGGQEFGSKYSTATSLRPQGSLGTGNLQYDNKLSGSQYGNSSPTTSRPGSQDGNSPTSQYSGSTRPGSSSQGATIPTYDTTTGTINIGQKGLPRPGSLLFSKDRPNPFNQYGTSDSSSTLPISPSFPTQGSQSFLTNKVPSFGSSSSEFPKQLNQSPVSQTGASAGSSYGSKRPFESPDFPSQNDAQSPTFQSRPFTTSGSGSLDQNSGYQYNNPGSLSSGTRPGIQKFPSQASSSIAPKYGASKGTTSGTNSQIRPQDFTSGSIAGSGPSRPYNSQPATSQYNRPANAQYEISAASSDGLESSRPVSGLSSISQYTRPTSTTFGPVKTNSQVFPAGQSGLNQRPQFEFPKTTGFLKPTFSSPEGQNTQKQDESGYKYSRPQTQYGQQDGKLSGSRYTLPESGTSLNPINKESIIGSSTSGDNYNPTGTSGSGPKGISNTSGFPKFQGSLNQNYPSGQSPTDSQDSPFPGSGQYTLTGISSKPTGSTFPRRDKPVDNTPTYQFGQITPSNTPMLDSAPYQYNRPGQSGFQPTFGSSGGKRPEQIGSQPTFGASGQERPGQVGSQPTFELLGQQKTGQVGSRPTSGLSGPERPGQVGSQPTFGSSGQQKPVKVVSQPTFGTLGQERPGQVGSQPIFESLGQKKPGQVGSQPTFGTLGQEKPGQVGSQPTFGSLGLKKPGQVSSQSTFGASGQERPGQVGSQPTFGLLGQERPGQVGSQPTFASTGQERPGQVSSQPTFGSSGQERPGQVGYQPSFGSSGQQQLGQVGSQSNNGLSKQERPGQFQPGYDSLNQENRGEIGSQSGYDYSKPNRPGQVGSQSNFSPSSQNVPSQTGTQSSFGFAGQDRPIQNANQPNFGSTGQQRPDQKGFPSGSGTVGSKGPGQTGYQSPQLTSSRQDRPGQYGNGKPTENFNGPRQPPSFSPEEGYKY